MTTETVPDDGDRSGPSRRALVAAAVVVLAVVAAAVVGGLRGGRAAPAEPAPAAAVSEGSGEVSAFPVPGTAVVRPEAQLSFRGDVGDLSGLEVVGSRSGEHAGTLVEHSDGGGASFLTDEPFEQGERVTVSTGLPVRGTDDGEYTLTVAELGQRPPLEPPPVQSVEDARARASAGGASADPAPTEMGSAPGGPAASGEPSPTPSADPVLAVEHVHEFASAPGIEPPRVEVTGPEAGTTGPDDEGSPGLTALGIKNGYGQKGPILLDDAGETVWFRPLDGVDARDVQVQTLGGEPVLTWWEGRMNVGYGYGEAVVVDEAYEEVARVRMTSGYDADSHEFRLTDAGTALLMAYEPVRMDLRPVGGPADGQVVDNVVQEIDVATGALLFEWHSVGTVGLDESYLELPEDHVPYDYFHANSIDVDDDGDLLVSARHVCSVVSLDRVTGAVEWRLGGRESDLEMGAGATFLKQHDARRSADGTLTVFDNGGTCGGTTRESSRGLALVVDEVAMTVEVAREHPHPEGLFSESQANYQELEDGSVFLGWGSLPRFTLMSADGEVLLDGTVPDELSVTSYRAHRVEWTGRPSADPAAVLVEADGTAAVHVSWNGATEVDRWRVLDEAGAEVASAARAGFETVLPLGAAAIDGDLRVEALDAAGEVLGEADVAG
ncbi:arylsulfotransferase family protein [Actinotalea ferrariae]|uniref:arylsulfotransferase family protein n=1 Tax=Actinotalea ferrariae TaxID=1386098 RepID=UPI001C8CA932|nr:arylsulfotransferase family protein [Actinotalea ferrariae]MBX9244115.1 arylsulfotransferase family protein [Actinotalea ferrariae]